MRNWKTTLLGMFTGGTLSIDAILKDGFANGWQQALIGLGIILLGAFSKDHDVTGTGKNG